MHIKWRFSFSSDDMKSFAKLSGDYNPIHIDDEFAKSKGFAGVLIYGLLLSTQISRLVGQELPDKNAILTGIQLDFFQPAFLGNELDFLAELSLISEATQSLEFKCKINHGDKNLCRGRVFAIWRP